jgi:hypothetical protein
MDTTSSRTIDKVQIPVKSKQYHHVKRSHYKEPAPLLIFTHHSTSQQSRRRVSPEAIEAAFLYGSELRRTGARFLILLGDDIERAQKPELKRFEGTTLVLAEDIILMTCYVNRDAHRRIKKLPKHGFKKHGFKWDPPRPGAPACALRAA